ncbi:hypothetical protein RUND412_003720 [Rhizina undulata]
MPVRCAPNQALAPGFHTRRQRQGCRLKDSRIIRGLEFPLLHSRYKAAYARSLTFIVKGEQRMTPSSGASRPEHADCTSKVRYLQYFENVDYKDASNALKARVHRAAELEVLRKKCLVEEFENVHAFRLFVGSEEDHNFGNSGGEFSAVTN